MAKLERFKQFLRERDWAAIIVAVIMISIMINAIRTGNPNHHPLPAYSGLVLSPIRFKDFIEEDGKVAQDLQNLLKLYKIEYGSTAASANEALQRHFLRNPDDKSWGLQDSTEDQRLRSEAMYHIDRMGLTRGHMVRRVDTDYFLLFGGPFSKMEKRFADFLKRDKAKKLQCKTVVLLGGARTLLPTELDSLQQNSAFEAFLRDQKKTAATLTEADLWRFMWQTQASDALKAQFQESKHNLCFVDATLHSADRTDSINDTIETWLEDFKPAPGKCHANVENPYLVRIEKSLRYLLEKYSQEHKSTEHFSITWNYAVAEDKILLAIYKDEIARTFAQEYILRKYIGMLPDETEEAANKANEVKASEEKK